MLNPFSLIHTLATQTLQDFWIDADASSNITNRVKRQTFAPAKEDHLIASRNSLSTGDILSRGLYFLLYHEGYLTIQHVDDFHYLTLGTPNEEVRSTFVRDVLASPPQDQRGIDETVVHEF